MPVHKSSSDLKASASVMMMNRAKKAGSKNAQILEPSTVNTTTLPRIPNNRSSSSITAMAAVPVKSSVFSYQPHSITLAAKLQNKIVKGSLKHYEQAKTKLAAHGQAERVASVLAAESPTMPSPSAMAIHRTDGPDIGGSPNPNPGTGSPSINYRVALADRILMTKRDERAPETRKIMEREDAEVQLLFRHIVKNPNFRRQSLALSPLVLLELAQETLGPDPDAATATKSRLSPLHSDLEDLENAVFESIGNMSDLAQLPRMPSPLPPIQGCTAGSRHNIAKESEGADLGLSKSTDDLMQREMELMADAKRQGSRFDRMLQDIGKKLELAKKGIATGNRPLSVEEEEEILQNQEKLMRLKLEDASNAAAAGITTVSNEYSGDKANRTPDDGTRAADGGGGGVHFRLEPKNVIEEIFAFHTDLPDIANTYRNAFLARQSKANNTAGHGMNMINLNAAANGDFSESRHRIKAKTEVNNWLTFLRTNEIAKSAFLSAMRDLMSHMESDRENQLKSGIAKMGHDFVRENSEPGRQDRLYLPKARLQHISELARAREEKIKKVERSRRLVEIDREERLLNALAKHDDAIRQQMLIKGQEEHALKRKRQAWTILIIMQQKFVAIQEKMASSHTVREAKDRLVNGVVLAQRLWRRILRTRMKRQIEETVREVGHKLKPMLMSWQGRKNRRAGDFLVEHLRESQNYLLLARVAKNFRFNLNICSRQIKAYVMVMRAKTLLVHEQWSKWSYERATRDMVRGGANASLAVAANASVVFRQQAKRSIAFEDPKAAQRLVKIREFLLIRLRNHMKKLTESGSFEFSMKKPPPTNDIVLILQQMEHEDGLKYRQRAVLSNEDLEALDHFLLASTLSKK